MFRYSTQSTLHYLLMELFVFNWIVMMLELIIYCTLWLWKINYNNKKLMYIDLMIMIHAVKYNFKHNKLLALKDDPIALRWRLRWSDDAPMATSVIRSRSVSALSRAAQIATDLCAGEQIHGDLGAHGALIPIRSRSDGALGALGDQRGDLCRSHRAQQIAV